MTMKEYSTLAKTLESEPQHWMQFSLKDTSFLKDLTSLQEVQ